MRERIIVCVSAILVLCILFLFHQVGCGMGGGGDSIVQKVLCGQVSLFALLLIVTEVALAFSIIANKEKSEFLIKIFIAIFLFTLLNLASFGSYHGIRIQAVLLGGVTHYSCDSDKSAFPWGIITEDYRNQCYEWYGDCGEIIDENFFSEYSCYKKNGKSFSSYDDCLKLNNNKSQVLCMYDHAEVINDTDFCLSDIFLNSKEDKLNSVSRCFINVGTYKEKDKFVYGSTKDVITRCNKQLGINRDICITIAVNKHEDVLLCNQLSGHYPKLRSICFSDFEPKSNTAKNQENRYKTGDDSSVDRSTLWTEENENYKYENVDALNDVFLKVMKGGEK